jgi:hypothetical protein
MNRLADLILVVHALFVLFVVGGLSSIWLGAWRGWTWVRNSRFRAAHLAAILFVTAESLAGIACPLTVWEDMLRGQATQAGFIQRWVGQTIYYDFPAWAFTLVYVVFALIVVATYLLVPPRHRKQQKR